MQMSHDDATKAAKAFAQYKTVYKSPNSPLKAKQRREAIKLMPSYQWWDAYGARFAPELAYVACHVLSKPVGVGAVERSHKVLKGKIVNKHRNRLKPRNQNMEV